MRPAVRLTSLFALAGRFALAGLIGCTLSGCTSLVDLVVDDSDPDPGGKLQAMIGGQPQLEVPALAIGDPMVIKAANTNIVVSMTCGDDATGRGATTVLAAAGGTITLAITSSSRSQLQIHAGGMSCVATSGQIQLAADAMTAITGSFTADGLFADTMSPCSMSGTLSAVPQYH